MKINAYIFLSFFMLSLFASAQKENANWYFGLNAGVLFTSGGTAVADTNSQMAAAEGCVTISDSLGNLLFYSDGSNVWNKNHQVMPNGFGLLGNFSSFQACLVIKKPFSNTIYYIFTTSGYGSAAYSEIDMSLNGGLGDINAVKNVILMNNSSESVCAVVAEGCEKVWLVLHEIGNNKFSVFAVDSSGVATTPVSSFAGGVIGTVSAVCGLKANNAGTLLAQTADGDTVAYVLNFDKNTGIVSNGVYLPLPQTLGAEFSPNDSLLYITNSGYDFIISNGFDSLWQFNVSVLNQSAVSASKTLIHSQFNASGTRGELGTLQTAPNGKIYLAEYFGDYIGCINNPDNVGLACNYVDNAVFLLGRKSMLGLPHKLVQVKNAVADFKFQPGKVLAVCSGEPFTINSGLNADTYLWNTGSSLPSINANLPGFYALTATIGSCIYKDSVLVKEDAPAYVVPNIFSPNADGVNEVFKINASCAELEEARIYNRWGEQMHAWTGIENGWDGKTNGLECSEGVYFFTGKLRTAGGTIESLRAYVTLVK